MSDEKKTEKVNKEKKTKAPKDHWFSFSGIRKEAKRVRWPHWKSEGASKPGILHNTGEVVVFTASFALFFVLCEFVITYLLKFIGIGA